MGKDRPLREEGCPSAGGRGEGFKSQCSCRYVIRFCKDRLPKGARRIPAFVRLGRVLDFACRFRGPRLFYRFLSPRVLTIRQECDDLFTILCCFLAFEPSMLFRSGGGLVLKAN
jgi:hypothetical protein